MQNLFTRYVVDSRPEGALGAVADLLAEDRLTRVTFDEVVAQHGVASNRAFRDGLLDLILYAAREAVRDHCLSTEEVDTLRRLTVTFRVREGEFVARRGPDVAALLQGEVYRLLADDVVDGPEAAYADQLQSVFGLGYDEYLALVHDAFTPAVDRALAQATSGSWTGAPERARFERALAALRTVYVLSPAQRRAPSGWRSCACPPRWRCRQLGASTTGGVRRAPCDEAPGQLRDRTHGLRRVPYLTNTTVKAYKYRSASQLPRDLGYLVEDAFFAPTAQQLNDPTEVVLARSITIDHLRTATRDFSCALDQFEQLRHSVGIYSLSRVATDEIMWAHYAESHAGYCIEYDLERLILEARNQWTVVNVTYADRPPSIELEHVLRGDSGARATAKLVGHKSQRWAYEDELRIVTARAGKNHYARAAVTGVYFGCRCSEDTRKEVRSALWGRPVRYAAAAFPECSYQITLEPLPRGDADGHPVHHCALVEPDAVPTADELHEFAHLHAKVLKAVEIVRRDPSCAAVVYANVSRSGPHRGQIFVQFRTLVPTDLYDVLNWRFGEADL